MGRIAAGDADDITKMPLAFRRAHGLDMSWQARAECRSAAPDLWFSTDAIDKMAALTICGQCSAQWDCASYALRAEEPYGIWGATQEDLRWATAHRGRAIIAAARKRRVPAQVAIRDARDRSVRITA